MQTKVLNAALRFHLLYIVTIKLHEIISSTAFPIDWSKSFVKLCFATTQQILVESLIMKDYNFSTSKIVLINHVDDIRVFQAYSKCIKALCEFLRVNEQIDKHLSLFWLVCLETSECRNVKSETCLKCQRFQLYVSNNNTQGSLDKTQWYKLHLVCDRCDVLVRGIRKSLHLLYWLTLRTVGYCYITFDKYTYTDRSFQSVL